MNSSPSSYPSAAEPDLSRRSPAEADEIRRAIAWQLCDAMPPNDSTLRYLYADDVTLHSLGVDSFDRLELALTLEEKFPQLGEIEERATQDWQTIGDIIAFVQSKFENRESKIS